VTTEQAVRLLRNDTVGAPVDKKPGKMAKVTRRRDGRGAEVCTDVDTVLVVTGDDPPAGTETQGDVGVDAAGQGVAVRTGGGGEEAAVGRGGATVGPGVTVDLGAPVEGATAGSLLPGRW